MHILPELPYAYDALEPHLDAQTMKIHHTKHHQGYVNKLNAALDANDALKQETLEDLLKNLDGIPADIRTAVRNNGGGHYNHSLFWQVMTPEAQEPTPEILEKLNESFGSYDAFKEAFEQAAKIRFGSGWAWLVKKADGSLAVMSTANQDNPLMSGEGTPILGLDVWEHAYYLHYQNRRPDYVSAWWSVVNWQQVQQNYNNA